MTTYVTSHDKIADYFNVSRHTVREWVRRAGFPNKSKKGWDIKNIDEFLRRHALGPHRDRRATRVENGNASTMSLTEAKIRKTLESAERDRIAKELAEMELQGEKGNIFWADDIRQRDERIASTTITILQQIPDAVDQAVGDTVSAKIRSRAVEDAKRIVRDALSAIEELVRKV